MYKYSLSATGTNYKVEEFYRALKEIGYTGKGSVGKEDRVVIANEYKKARNLSLSNGETMCFPRDIDAYPREYKFNIDNDWEYKAALAIATIRDDDVPYVGELVVSLNEHFKAKGENLYKIEKSSGFKRGNYCTEGYDGYCTWEVSLETGYSRKATAEEIINFYKSKNVSKEIIGYKLKDKKYENLAIAVLNTTSEAGWWNKYAEKNLRDNGWNFVVSNTSPKSGIEGAFYNAGVLDVWFDPVFKAEFVKGEWVTDDDGKNLYKYGEEKNGKHYTQEIGGIGSVSFGPNLRKATYEEIKKEESSVIIKGYKSRKSADCIIFGCKHFSKEGLFTVRNLLDDEIGAKITIGDTDVTIDMINKLLKMLDGQE